VERPKTPDPIIKIDFGGEPTEEEDIVRRRLLSLCREEGTEIARYREGREWDAPNSGASTIAPSGRHRAGYMCGKCRDNLILH
jgi:hypothetical protein